MSEKLRELRKAAGLTQQALADIIGVPRRLIIKYEQGETKPENMTLSKAIKYADALGVDPRDLLDDLPESE